MSVWRAIPFVTAGLVLAPIGVVLSSLLAPVGDIWQHLVETSLPLLLLNTFWLACGVIAGTAILGISLAWITAVYEFQDVDFFLGIIVAHGHTCVCHRICCIRII